MRWAPRPGQGGATGLVLGGLEVLAVHLPAGSPDWALATVSTALLGAVGAVGGLAGRAGALAALALVTVAPSHDAREVLLRALLLALAAGAGLALGRLGTAGWGVLALPVAFSLAGREPPAEPRGDVADVVLVVLDTVAFHATTVGGASLPTTPALQALAEGGLSFSGAVAPAPWTLPSHATLFTGRLPREVGVHQEHPQLLPDAPTLAEVLGRAGWRTGAFVGNPWVGRGTGLTRGFDHEVHALELAASVDAWAVFRWVPRQPGKGGPLLVDRALAFLDGAGASPGFVFLNVLEAHVPYAEAPDAGRFLEGWSPEAVHALSERVYTAQLHGPWEVGYPRDAAEVEHARTLYLGAVAAADEVLARLVAGLRERGRLERTLLVVTSDHGEAFGEHGVHGHLVGLHPEVLRVPLVLHGAGVQPGVVEEVVGLAGLPGEILRRVGLETEWAPLQPGQAAVSEHTRPRILLGDGMWGADHQGGPWDRAAVRVEQGGASLLETRPVGQPASLVAYDLVVDPHELRAGPEGPEHTPLREVLDGHRELADPSVGRETPERTEGMREALRALGYVE